MVTAAPVGQEQWLPRRHRATATKRGTSHRAGVSALQRHRAAPAGSPEETRGREKGPFPTVNLEDLWDIG